MLGRKKKKKPKKEDNSFMTVLGIFYNPSRKKGKRKK